MQSTRHTVAFGTRVGTPVGPLFVTASGSTSGWTLAADVVGSVVSSDAIYFQLLLCP